MSQVTRVLIADRDAEFSESLQSFLDQFQEIEVIGIVQDGQGAVNAFK